MVSTPSSRSRPQRRSALRELIGTDNDAWLDIGRAAAETGDYQRIRRLVADCPTGHLRNSLTLPMVEALVEDGEFAEATGLVGTIDAPDQKARAWIALTEAGHLRAKYAHAPSARRRSSGTSCGAR